MSNGISKERFIQILTESGVPKECHQSWLKMEENRQKYPPDLNFGGSGEDVLRVTAKLLVEKGCCAGPKW